MGFFVATSGVTSLVSYKVLLVFDHSLQHQFIAMGGQIASKTHFPNVFLIGLVFSRNIASVYFADIQSNKAISVRALKSSTSHMMYGNIYVINFTRMVFK